MAHGRLEEVATVAGYAARRCGIFGRCQRQDCRRTCQFDFERLLKGGMADLQARQVMQTFRCARLDGCGLEFREEPARVVTLAELAGRDYVGVEIRCVLCGAKYLTTIEGLIARLVRAGQGGPQTSIKNVGALIRGPCGACKTARWEVSFPWYDPTGHKIPIWKQDLQKRIDDSRRRQDLDRGLVT